MTLDAFFKAIAPLLEGRVTPDAAAQALWGDAPQGAAERLGIYARFCRNHRFEALESTFAQCRAVVIRRYGMDTWADLVDSYFRAHPMHHVELNENGSDFLFFDTSPSSRHQAKQNRASLQR